MKDYSKLCMLVDAEIDKEVAKGSLTPETIRTIGYAIDVIKDIKTIEAMESEYGYSGHYPERGWNVRPYYSYEDAPDYSYARRRDSMGRYSREDGYSRKMDDLERMMNEARSEDERELYRKLIEKERNH